MDSSSKNNLFEKYGDGTLTEKERNALHNWYFDQISADEPVMKPEVLKMRTDEMDAVIFAKLNTSRTVNLKTIISIAAFLLIAVSAVFYFMPGYKEKNNNLPVYAAVVIPGNQRAVLTLENGRHLDLTTVRKGSSFSQNGVQITKTHTAEVTYRYTSGGGNNTYNTISVPEGAQYQVQLPDGSVVRLNAVSTLRYPTSFASLSERRVKLTGEAYFEVKHNATQPFIVETEGQTVKDIGTQFNINAYAEEPASKTAVLEGAVAVMPAGPAAKNTTHKAASVLKPGQQSLLSNGNIRVIKINAEDAVAWKNGYFQFQADDLESGMRQIARWYNVEIVYQGAVPEDKLYGRFHRNADLLEALRILLGTAGITYQIDHNRVTIMK